MSRRALILGTGAAIGVVGARKWRLGAERALPVDLAYSAISKVDQTFLNDASGMSHTPVARHVIVTAGSNEEVERRLLNEVALSQEVEQPMIASGPRLSQGGQSIASNGATVSLNQGFVVPYPGLLSYKTTGGTRWSSVIDTLDGHGFSPSVMQPYNDFSVAGAFATNAHGWSTQSGSVGSTALSLRMIKADGSLVTCARRTNSELFRVSMGGYGLFGVITEVQLQMAPNARLRRLTRGMKADDLPMMLAEQATEHPEVVMAYGQTSLSQDDFLSDAQLISYHREVDQTYLPPAPQESHYTDLDASAFRAQAGSDRNKQLRWWMERNVEPRFGRTTTRNAVLNRPIGPMIDPRDTHSNIQQGYFIPPEGAADFISACRDHIPNSYQDLIDFQMCFVSKDDESVLTYAADNRIAFHLTFCQERSTRADLDMQRLNRALIDRALSLGGSFYLPYRLHATLDQIEAAYPNVAEFAKLKREYDPEGRFSNALWKDYLDAF